jgi:hypothetical protein
MKGLRERFENNGAALPLTHDPTHFVQVSAVATSISEPGDANVNLRALQRSSEVGQIVGALRFVDGLGGGSNVIWPKKWFHSEHFSGP